MSRRFAVLAALGLASCAATPEGLQPDAKVTVPDASLDAGATDGGQPMDAAPDAWDADLDAGHKDAANGGGGDGGCVVTGLGELCNGIDDNCNGQTDEGYAVGSECTVGQGICERTGQSVCSANGMGTECDVQPGPAGPELCGNGLDDDCNGLVDDGFEDLGMPCHAGLGACQRSGVWVCSTDRLTLECSATPGTPGVEICNGIDDNCDGNVDELWPTEGQPCDGPDTDLCAEGQLVCNAEGTALVCTDNTGNNAELCDGVDNDCNPATPDGSDEPSILIPTPCTTTDDTCLEGYIYCSAQGTLACSDPGNDNTTNDPDACGNCFHVCENPHGGRYCVNSSCAPTCYYGWQACGALDQGCLSLRNTNPSCWGSDLGSVDGDDSGGGDNGTNKFIRSAYAEAQYRYWVKDTTTYFNDTIGVKLTLQNPPHVRFGLCVTCFDCGSSYPTKCLSPAPTAGGSGSMVVAKYDHGGSPDDHYQIANVYYISGDTSSCQNWTLTIQGNQDNSSDRTCGN